MNIETVLKLKRNVLATVYRHLWEDSSFILTNSQRMFIFEVATIKLLKKIDNIIYNRVGLEDSVWIVEW